MEGRMFIRNIRMHSYIGISLDLFYTPLHIKLFLSLLIILAIHNLFESAHRVFKPYVFPFHAGKHFRDVGWLGKEFLNFRGAIDSALVLLRQLFNAKNRDDVLQVLISLKNLLHRARNIVMVFSHDVWVKGA